MTCYVSHHCFAHRARPDVSAEVDRSAAPLELTEVAIERGPRLSRVWNGSKAHVRPRRMDFARDLACNPLCNLRDGVRSAKYRRLGMAEHVDEARRHNVTACIYDTLCSQSRKRGTDVGNSIAVRCDATA